MPRISVLLPIYNAEPFLRECLESIRVQSLQDIEVLCVNDGSTDSSLETMRAFASADSRFKVLDKPNGGYGNTLNYGLERARGEYVSIVEPDDFIHPEMLEDLYVFSRFGGQVADVVKGSYWEFYDGADGFSDEVHVPNLSRAMGGEPYAFTLEEDTEVFQHHPSIWSAIYRRDFLEDNRIRFVEPKGAGWADNPFFAETLVCAERIVWVPKQYYYYRQTNPNASSFLKDYRIPFERLREMRSILREHDVSADVWAAFYLREFFYMNSIIGEFGFEESDPEVQSLIVEALSDMNADIVFNHETLRTDDVVFYQEVMGVFEPAATSASSGRPHREDPAISFIVPVHDDARWIQEALESLRSLPAPFEALMVDCGCHDRSMRVCQLLSHEDARFEVLEGAFTDASGLNAALDRVSAPFFYVLHANMGLLGTPFGHVLAGAMELGVDVMLMDTRKRFSVDALRASGSTDPHDAFEHDGSAGIVSGRFSPDEASSFLLNCSFPNLAAGIYRTGFVRDVGLRFGPADAVGDGAFLGRALCSASSASYAGVYALCDLDDLPADTVPLRLDLRDWHIRERPLALPAALRLAGDGEISSRFAQSVANLLLESFMYDLAQRRTPDSIREYCEELLPRVTPALDAEGRSGRFFHDGELHGEYQLLRHGGLESYLASRYLIRERDAGWLQIELRETLESATYKAGERVKAAVSSVVPLHALGKLRAGLIMRRGR